MAIEQAGLADLLQQIRLEAVEISKLTRGACSECSLMYLMLMAFIKTKSSGKAECLSIFKMRKQLQTSSSGSQNDCFYRARFLDLLDASLLSALACKVVPAARV